MAAADDDGMLSVRQVLQAANLFKSRMRDRSSHRKVLLKGDRRGRKEVRSGVRERKKPARGVKRGENGGVY